MANDLITEALLAAKAAVGHTVYKGGYNEAQRFSYVGHEQVVRATKDALLKNGLDLVQVAVEFKTVLPFKTKTGDAMCWLWEGKFKLSHISGQSRELSFSATTQCNDKASYIASTALDRTALLRVLGLAGSNEEDPEHNSHDEEPQHQAPLSQRAPAGHGQASQRLDDGEGGASELRKLDDELKQIQGAKTPATDKGAALMFWAADLRLLRTRFDKGPLWSAFASACADLELVPGEIVSKADEYNRKQGAKQ